MVRSSRWWWCLVLAACEPMPKALEVQAYEVVKVARPAVIDLRVDANRNGVLDLADPTEDEGEDGFTQTRGAVFLANLDDDAMRCRQPSRTAEDAVIANCNDASDEVVNGDLDLADLAPLALVPFDYAPEGTTGTLDLSAAAKRFVRVFRRGAAGLTPVAFPLALSTAELREGLTLFVEGKDIRRNLAVWDGVADFTVTAVVPEQDVVVPGTVTDMVRLTLSPVMTFHHLLKAKNVFVTAVPRDPDSTTFVSALRAAVAAYDGQVPVTTSTVQDQWTQDFFETGYMAMPGPNGSQRVMHVFFRSANIEDLSRTGFPLREAGRVVFTQFRGQDVAGIQQVDMSTSGDEQSLNSFGNFETVPPYTHEGRSFPLGRMLRGATATFRPDTSFTRMMDAQRLQPVIELDTSWLAVGHVDETTSFLKVNSPRGWVLLVNDARLARSMLQMVASNGGGSTPMMVGKEWVDENGRLFSAQRTVNQVLADPEVAADSNAAAVKVDAQLAILKRETGITDAEIIKVPFLHQPTGFGSVAYTPGTVNMLVLDDKNVVIPDPHGPIVGGRDIFRVQLETALQPYQVRVHWIDDWDLYHRNMGEIHCGTNALRETPSVKWWEVTP